MLFSFVYFFCLPCSLSVPFCCNFLGARHIFRGKAWAEGKGALATARTADRKVMDKPKKITTSNLGGRGCLACVRNFSAKSTLFRQTHPDVC